MIDIDYRPFEPASADGRALADALSERAPRLAAVMARCERIFALASELAPGLAFFGAEGLLVPGSSQRVSSSGTGSVPLDALVSCLGELVERASQYERPGDVAHTAPLAEVEASVLREALPALHEDLARAALAPGDAIDWLAAKTLDGAEVLLPADWCLRRSAAGAIARPEGTALSTGLAAGATREAAVESALLELIERDAAALWWRGRQPPRPLPDEAEALGRDLLAELRRGADHRTTRFLDLTTDICVPVVAALSFEPDGMGLCCGTAARPSRAAAVKAALLELCSLELGLEIARLRERAGKANAGDLRHLARAAARLPAHALLQPEGEPMAAGAGAAPIAAQLAARGIAAALVDLTRVELGVPVVMAVAPALQLMPGGPMTGRLSKAYAPMGRAMRWTEPDSPY